MMNRKIIVTFCSVLFLTTNTAFSKVVEKIGRTDIPTSKALPKGMRLVWNDEFNGKELNRSKWSTNYFSSLNMFYKENVEMMLNDELPQPTYEFTGNSIVLRTDDNDPQPAYQSNGRKISSIQTYDWRSDKNMMDNSLGGYFEARIKRSAAPDAEMVNGAFWFDAPGPDLKYYLEQGSEVDGVKGIRPRGQLFEIDMCEYLTTEIVLHGNVASDGNFERNIGHYIVEGDFKDKWVTHSVLWTPRGLKFYIDGELVNEWWDPNDIKSPNHAMNMFFGVYGKGAPVTMEVDYVRYYAWDMEKGNMLPNAGFEYSGDIFPWEGNGTVDTNETRSGNNCLKLASGQQVTQYVYLDHSKDYELSFWGKGNSEVEVSVENITMVNGEPEGSEMLITGLQAKYIKRSLTFSTYPEYLDNKSTVRITFTNNGNSDIRLDDMKINESKYKSLY